jgi:hypothetical protein
MSVRRYEDSTTQLSGTPIYLGTIVATTTKNNHDTAVPFSNTGEALKGKVIILQGDTDFYLLPSTLNSGTTTTANGVRVLAYERVEICMGTTYGWVACLAVSGTSNVKVWELA